jgi:predicted DNA-binding transcriptional regulator AlpA
MNAPHNDFLDTMALLNAREAAVFLRLSKSTLDKLRTRSEGPKFIRLGRKILYDKVDLIEWARARRFGSTTEYC